MAYGVKDTALSLLGHRLDPWPRNFCMPWVQPKKGARLPPLSSATSPWAAATTQLLESQWPKPKAERSQAGDVPMSWRVGSEDGASYDPISWLQTQLSPPGNKGEINGLDCVPLGRTFPIETRKLPSTPSPVPDSVNSTA